MLEDGFSLTGECFSGTGEFFGEVVFNTAMAGYQEIITDPSCKGQILAFTYPLIGNYGVNSEDAESASPQVEAVLVKEYCRRPFNWRAAESLGDYLERYGVLGVEGIDTRSLTLHLRRQGTMRGGVSAEGTSPEELLERVRSYPRAGEQDLVGKVTCTGCFSWAHEQEGPLFFVPPESREIGKGRHVVVYDFGVKYSILRQLAARGCRITVIPAGTTTGQVEELKPDGVVLSNGPGDPAAVTGIIPAIRSMLGKYPLFGISLGHQIIARALGLETYKLPFGHRGANYPVRELAGGRVQITTQNHGYCVKLEREYNGTVPTHINLNDGTLEGMENRALKFFSVQFHPEASPGAPNALSLFDRLFHIMDEN